MVPCTVNKKILIETKKNHAYYIFCFKSIIEIFPFEQLFQYTLETDAIVSIISHRGHELYYIYVQLIISVEFWEETKQQNSSISQLKIQ